MRLVVESRIEEVCVYASGARVRRIAMVLGPLQARGVVRFAGLPLALIDDSVRAEIAGPAVATQVRVSLDVPDGEPAVEQPAELVAARKRAAVAASEVARLDGALAALAQASVLADDPSDDPPASFARVIAARRALVGVRAERELALRRAWIDARRAHEEATRALQVQAERYARASSARSARVHELRKVVDLDVAAADPSATIEVRLEYRVLAARWAPSYVARLDGGDAVLEVRAVVAQRSGEDWRGARMRLSTAEPEQFAPLPELTPQKIGRRQDAPGKTGFRAPPSGADALFLDHDRVAVRANAAPDSPPSPPPRDEPEPEPEELQRQVWDEQSSRAKEAFHTPPYGAMPMPMMQSAPAPGAAPAKKRESMRLATRSGGGGGAAANTMFGLEDGSATAVGGGAYKQKPEPAPPPAPVPRLDYGSLRMAGAGDAGRGTLVPAGRSPLDAPVMSAVRDAVHALAHLELPRGCVGSWAHTYDHAFDTDGVVDVDSDGAWHALAVTARPAKVTLRHVAVPREQPDVFRVATIANPHVAPLLPGPIDIYDRGTFLVTSEVDFTSPGAALDVGLGVDAAVKVARNAEFREEATGMLRGALRLLHAITVDVENLSGRAVDVEVRERVPVSREGDDSVEVVVGRVEPAWDRWTPDPSAPKETWRRGTHRWRVQLPAGAKKQLRAAYEVKIASKLELVGGNRREP
ncbi:MAG TPA: DUF4139 domain-containing protein [Byssovorax sp.]